MHFVLFVPRMNLSPFGRKLFFPCSFCARNRSNLAQVFYRLTCYQILLASATRCDFSCLNSQPVTLGVPAYPLPERLGASWSVGFPLLSACVFVLYDLHSSAWSAPGHPIALPGQMALG